MAKYSREFLVPYLQDICAVYMAKGVLDTKVAETENQIRYNQYLLQRQPQPPARAEPEAVGCGYMLAVGFGLFVLFEAIFGFVYFIEKSNFMVFGSIFVALFGLFILAACRSETSDIKERNCQNEAQYQEAVRTYEQTLKVMEAENLAAQKEIPKLEHRLSFLKKERKKSQHLLDKLYGASVLPTRYRDIYAAVYLYDYFSNSLSDDLDMVLNTYVLEQIKDKLDEIISNQYKMILNQRMILANQQSQLDEQERYHQYMKEKINEITDSNEERNQYLNMIAGHLSATTYFAAADYLKS